MSKSTSRHFDNRGTHQPTARCGEAGIISDVSQEGRGIVANKIENAASSHGWVAAGAGIGPSAVQDNWSFLNKAGDTECAAAIRPDKRGTESATICWRRKDGLELSWSVRAAATRGVMEFQSELTNAGTTPIPGVKELGPLTMQLAANMEDLVVHYVTRTDYRKQQIPLSSHTAFEVKGGGWNSPCSAGWVAIENPKAKEILFLGVEWESYWTVRLSKGKDSGVLLECFLDTHDHELAPHASLASPRVFMGLSHGDVDDSLRVLHDHLRGIMALLPKDFPWVSYDIWGTEAAGVEAGILAEIPFAAKIGVDLFYIDASWYDGSCKNGSGDWFTGVGNYGKEDRVKYPSGLAAISKKVHDAGMKFGLWFAPQVVDSSLIGTVIAPDFAARRDSQDIFLRIGDWAPITQICTGNPAVVEHLKKAMGDAVEHYGLDWVKWDNSGLPGAICNRTDHGHQGTDGALAALNGQYEIWRYLRDRFPKLMLEECGYPSRLDYGLARTATSHWLADDTAHAEMVRRSQIHASYVFPAAHYSAWVLGGEGANDPAILDTVIRSRMIGQCGLGTLNGKLGQRASLFPPEVIDALSRNIKAYKQYRHLLREDAYHLLPPSTTADAWDGIEFCKRDGSEAVVLAFRGKSPETNLTLALRGLVQDASYEVDSCNTGETRTMKGTELGEGLKIPLPHADMSEILHMTRIPAAMRKE